MKILISVILSISLFLNGCTKSEPKKLMIYNWSYYIPKSVIEEFIKEYNVELHYDVYATNEEMHSVLKEGLKQYDLAFPSNEFISVLKNEGLIEKLDKAKLSNLKNLDQALLTQLVFDPQLEYSVPYVQGATGIAVNKEKIRDFRKDFSLFADPGNKGKLCLLDDMREVLGSALLMLGYSVNSVNSDELKAARALVLKWKANGVRFDSEAFGKAFAAGECWAAQGYAENIFQELPEISIKDTLFFIPEKGAQRYIDSMVLLKNAKNRETAYLFMNFVHRPQVYARIMDFVRAPSLNSEAKKYIKTAPHYTQEDLNRAVFKEDIGDKIDLQEAVWQEIISKK